MKLCKDCKYCSTIINYWCEHPAVGISMTDGKPNAMRCSTMRQPGGFCGISAQLFELKIRWYTRIKNSILNL